MVDLKKIFSEDELKSIQGEGACAIVRLEGDKGYIVICKKNVQDLLREIKRLKEINEEMKLLKLEL